MNRRNQMQQGQQGNMMIGGGESSFVSAEMLKQVSVPVEAMLGAVNGAISGAVVAGAVSAVVSFAHAAPGERFLKQAASNLVKSDKHLWPVLAGTTALATLGGIVRYSRAVKHNEWSVGHYAHLEHADAQQQRAGNFADQVTDSRAMGEQDMGR